MFALVIFFLSCSEYAFAQHINTTCVKAFQSEKYDAAPIPDEQELNDMCPDIIKYLDCYWNELQEDPEKYSDSQHFYYRNTGELLRDLCTDGSQIRQEYVFAQDIPDIDISNIPFYWLDIPQLPNEEDLSYMCPSMMDCLEDYRNQSQKNPDSFTDDQHLYFTTIGEFLRDLCTNGSQLRQNYLANYRCLEDTDEDYYTCKDAIKPLYKQWKVANPKGDPQITLKCLLQRYSVGCLALRIKEARGDLEYSTYMEVIERSSYLSEYCGTNFVNTSTLDSDYSELFNLTKND